MNVYEKLLKARVDLQSKKIKKGGQNEFVKFAYFELADFVPTINLICDNLKIIPLVSFGEVATMRIVDAEKPDDVIVFTSPMSTASLKGCHEVQNLGAVETYLRRYLYLTAFEINEPDALDKTVGTTNNDKFDDMQTKYRVDLEARVMSCSWDEDKKGRVIRGIPNYDQATLDRLSETLKKEGF